MDFTVILLRPERIAEDRQDVYIGFMKNQESTKLAVKNAQAEAWKADSKDGQKACKFEDYKLVAMFYGIQRVALYGWQI